ncbi:hypothetical protein ACLBVB_21940, partial [Pseudomonas aeruginosa]
MTHSVSPIGYIRSCFMEKFAIPRQPLLAPAARGTLELAPGAWPSFPPTRRTADGS